MLYIPCWGAGSIGAGGLGPALFLSHTYSAPRLTSALKCVKQQTPGAPFNRARLQCYPTPCCKQDLLKTFKKPWALKLLWCYISQSKILNNIIHVKRFNKVLIFSIYLSWVFWGKTDIKYMSFRCTTWWFNICIYHKMTTTINLVS